jgi:mycoredoxin
MFVSKSSAQKTRNRFRDVPVVVYGTNWCAQTMMMRRLLERLGVPYRYVDVEADTRAANQLRWWTGGYVSHPTIYIDGEILVEPSIGELQGALSRNGLF